MESFDSQLRELIEKWIKQGADLQSMSDAMGTELGKLWALKRERIKPS